MYYFPFNLIFIRIRSAGDLTTSYSCNALPCSCASLAYSWFSYSYGTRLRLVCQVYACAFYAQVFGIMIVWSGLSQKPEPIRTDSHAQ